MFRGNKAKQLFLEEMTEQMKFLDILFLGDGLHSDTPRQCVKAYRYFHYWKSSAPVFELEKIGQLAIKLELLWRWASDPQNQELKQSDWVVKFQSTCQASRSYYQE